MPPYTSMKCKDTENTIVAKKSETSQIQNSWLYIVDKKYVNNQFTPHKCSLAFTKIHYIMLQEENEVSCLEAFYP